MPVGAGSPWHTYVPLGTCDARRQREPWVSLIQALARWHTRSQGRGEQSCTLPLYQPPSASAAHPRDTGGAGEGQAFSYHYPYSLDSGKKKSTAYTLYREQVKVYIHSRENPSENRKQHAHPSARERARGRQEPGAQQEALAHVQGKTGTGCCKRNSFSLN